MHPEIEAGFSLKGRVAVVTGAASGIGQRAAIMLAEAGARVLLADRNEAGLADTATRIAALGSDVLSRQVDVSDRSQVNALADYAVGEAGGIDVWANVAGVLLSGLVVDETEADFDRLMAVNLKGTYWGCAAAARVMTAQRRGSIINISSTAADFPAPGLSIYAMSKAAVNMLTRTLAHEVGPYGVRVNAIGPGWIETPMVSYRFRTADGGIDSVKRAETLKMRAEVSPMSLTGEPSDIGYAVLYLASDASRFMTGQVLRPNGGAAMV
jgi:3-oxoacyl-[acyl-carrier protein] reductase